MLDCSPADRECEVAPVEGKCCAFLFFALARQLLASTVSVGGALFWAHFPPTRGKCCPFLPDKRGRCCAFF